LIRGRLEITDGIYVPAYLYLTGAALQRLAGRAARAGFGPASWRQLPGPLEPLMNHG
jgi:hypothetical protein